MFEVGDPNVLHMNKVFGFSLVLDTWSFKWVVWCYSWVLFCWFL